MSYIRLNRKNCTCQMPLGQFQEIFEDFIRSNQDDPNLGAVINEFLTNSAYNKMCCRLQLLNPELHYFSEASEGRVIFTGFDISYGRDGKSGTMRFGAPVKLPW